MPRKRMIDPEFWKDEEIAECSFPARLFFIALWNFADDEGKFEAGANRLKHEIFPYDEKVTEKSIENFKAEVENMVTWYKIEDKVYGMVKNFQKHQVINHPSPSRIPNPTKENIVKLREHSGSITVGLPLNLIQSNLIKDNIRGRSGKVIEYLNEKSKRCFRATKTNLDLVENIFKDGYSEEDCKLVIDNRIYEWITKPKYRNEEARMAEYVRPSTIFRKSNFSQYFGIAKGEQEQERIKSVIEKKREINNRPDPKPTKEEEAELKKLTEQMKTSKLAQQFKLTKTLEALNEEPNKQSQEGSEN